MISIYLYVLIYMISADTKALEAVGGDIIIRESQIDGSVGMK